MPGKNFSRQQEESFCLTLCIFLNKTLESLNGAGRSAGGR